MSSIVSDTTNMEGVVALSTTPTRRAAALPATHNNRLHS
jgi:hypothetical protein